MTRRSDDERFRARYLPVPESFAPPPKRERRWPWWALGICISLLVVVMPWRLLIAQGTSAQRLMEPAVAQVNGSIQSPHSPSPLVPASPSVVTAQAAKPYSPIHGLPSGWEGECGVPDKRRMCSIWRHGPAETRLYISHYAQGGFSLSLVVPGKPSALRIAFDQLGSVSAWQIVPTRMQQMQAWDFEIELAIASTLFLEIDYPRRQLVAFPLDGIREALETLARSLSQ